MKKIMRMKIPVEMSVTFRGLEISSEDRLAEILLDFERQLNNLKLVSDVIPIGIYPRFHLGGNINEYTIDSTGDYDIEIRRPSDPYKREAVRLLDGSRKDSGVPKDAPLEQGSSPRISEKRGLQIIEETLSHFEDGLINVKETFNKIIDVVLTVTTKNEPGVYLRRKP